MLLRPPPHQLRLRLRRRRFQQFCHLKVRYYLDLKFKNGLIFMFDVALLQLVLIMNDSIERYWMKPCLILFFLLLVVVRFSLNKSPLSFFIGLCFLFYFLIGFFVFDMWWFYLIPFMFASLGCIEENCL